MTGRPVLTSQDRRFFGVSLSRGGSDDISNLQFMCRPHNSQKGASLPAPLLRLVGSSE